MANRKFWKAFRCTEKEMGEIERQAKKNGLSASDYIRRKVFWLPDCNEETLQELKHYLLKIGTNINQVVRSCNSKKFITTADYQVLVKYLKDIDEKFSDMIRLIREHNEKEFSNGIDSHIFNVSFFDEDGLPKEEGDE